MSALLCRVAGHEAVLVLRTGQGTTLARSLWRCDRGGCPWTVEHTGALAYAGPTPDELGGRLFDRFAGPAALGASAAAALVAVWALAAAAGIVR